MPIYLVFYFWLLVFSASVFVLERLFPWRREQEVLWPGFVQDLFWMVFNTQYVSWMLAVAAVHTVSWFNAAFLHASVPTPESLRLIAGWPAWVQIRGILRGPRFPRMECSPVPSTRSVALEVSSASSQH